MRADAVVVGAGAAGRSAALVLGRARKRVVVVDAGEPSNMASAAVGGLLGHDGRSPAELYAISDAELAAYPSVVRLAGTVSALRPSGHPRWAAEVGGGATVEADHVLLAMGMRYARPAIAGIEPLWGASVFHCPFCHGWEHRDQRLAVLGGGPATVERTLLLTGWSASVTLVAPAGTLDAADRAVLARAGVEIVDGTVERLAGTGRALEAMHLHGGAVVLADALLVTAAHEQRSTLVEQLRVAMDATGHVVVDDIGRTNLAGVWAAGDLTTPVSQVSRAVAAGALCAIWITHQIVAETYGLVFPPAGAPGGPAYAPGAPSVSAARAER